MRTYKNLWDKFISKDNFEKAYHDARLGKAHTRQVKKFEKNKEENLERVRQLVVSGNFHTSEYKEMMIFEPKKRIIYKLPFSPDRIVQHALMNVLIPIFQPMFIADSYSCIEGRGQMSAMHRCNEFVRRNTYCLKCDVRKFYPSVNHVILYRMIKRKIKDKKVFKVIEDIIRSYPGPTNVPIGNYTSQWFGNFYLTKLDNFIKQKLKIKDYLRYCDDFLLFSDDKEYLNFCRKEIHKFLHFELKLEFSKANLFNVKQGVDFVGYRCFGSYTLLRKSTAKRLKKRVRDKYPKMSESKRIMSKASANGWLKHCCSFNFKISLGFVSPEERWVSKFCQGKQFPYTKKLPC